MCTSAFEALFSKNVPHILENIFLSLEYESFKQCLEVNKAWSNLLSSGTLLRKAKSIFQEDIREDQEKLWKASRNGNIEETRRLLSSGLTNVNTWNNFSTSLYVAASYGREGVVQLLLDKGAEIDMGWRSYESPLHAAAANGHINVVKLLLNRGAEYDKISVSGKTPLGLAALCKRKDVVELLLDFGADPNHADIADILQDLHVGPRTVV